MPGLLHAVANQLQSVIQTLSQAVATASGTGVDISDYEGLIAVTCLAPNIEGTPTSVIFTVETSDVSGSGYTVVATGPTWTVGAAANVFRQVLDTDALKRFVRTTMTLVGGTSPKVSGNSLLLGVKKIQ